MKRELIVSLPPQRTWRANPWLLFAGNFFKHPKMLGTPIPSSRRLVDGLLSRVNWTSAEVIVEYGPGVGSITTEILRRMQPKATLVAIETNGDFVEYLRGTVDDARLRLVHGSAEQAGAELARLHCGPADCIISGIPFSTMPREGRESVLKVTHDALHPQGAFLAYQYSRSILPTLKRVFRKVRRDFLFAKMVPLWVFHCSRE